MKIIEKLKDIIATQNIKKTIYNFLAVIISCIILLISWSTFYPKENKSTEKIESLQTSRIEKNEYFYTDSIDKKLEQILSQINGVGDVDVMITYETSSEVVPASNITKSLQTTKENDSQGGTRTTTQENITEQIVTLNNSDYKNAPVVIKEIKPIVRGVIVVAEGAGNPKVKSALIDAVTTIFQIKSYKVKVYEKK
ncbi:stage III sporulation protein AG [Caminicella sporogenes DSM 14501]|uniref:Stage III sporulation protein AG n=1 Tax=Caminicella sporogenes DSM 14501 TaxID=1121266 RepID=A0A1M6LLW2_9FIRM|nr:stage III sporulation protein AG [Caminicella sporogenes]SHJ72251.1 stage III sporulation protein AG [Caminicella sporogenes DSM 14501]